MTNLFAFLSSLFSRPARPLPGRAPTGPAMTAAEYDAYCDRMGRD